MEEVVIVSAARTPVGAFNGAFGSLPAHKLGEVAVRAALERAKLDGADVSEVILGQVLTAAQGQNPARQAAIAAGLPIGTMFTARVGDEATLFRLAGQLEQARPWRARRPAVHASVAPARREAAAA